MIRTANSSPSSIFGPHMGKNTIFKKSDQTSADDSGEISPFRAFCLAGRCQVGAMWPIFPAWQPLRWEGPALFLDGMGLLWYARWSRSSRTSLGLYYRRKGPDGKSRQFPSWITWNAGFAPGDGLEIRKPLAISVCHLPAPDGIAGKRRAPSAKPQALRRPEPDGSGRGIYPVHRLSDFPR